MPEATTYECMVMFDTSRVSGNIEGGRDALLALFEKHHCEVIAHRLWDERRLAYPIGNQKKGIYYLSYLKAEDPRNIPELEGEFRISELITRYHTIKIHPKWVEPLLEVIRDERATCLRLMGDDLDDSTSRHVPRTGPAAVPEEEEKEPSPEGEPQPAGASTDETPNEESEE